MNAKDLMKIAGVESEEEFYSMYPTEEAFFEAFPDAAEYKKGGKIKKKFKPQDSATGYREFPPNVMQMGGAIDAGYDSNFTAPQQESQFNVTNQAKRTGQVMSKAENALWTAADVVVGATKFIHGQDVTPSKMTGKVNPYSGQVGSWYSSGGNKAQMPKAAEDKIMDAMQGKGDRDKDGKGPGSQGEGSPTGAPMGGEAPAGSIGGASSIAGAATGAAMPAPSMGNTMNKYGGPLQMDMGGLIPGTTIINSDEPFGATLRAYGGNIRDSYSTNYMSPAEEAQFNNNLMLKRFDSLKQMTPRENVGWTIADIVTSPVSSFTGKNTSELASNKANPYNNRRGSWWGNIEGTYVKPAVQNFLADSNIPYVSQVAGMGRDVRNVVAPMLIDERDDPDRLQKQAMMGQIGAATGKMVGSFMKPEEEDDDEKDAKKAYGRQDNTKLMNTLKVKYGGTLNYQMGGMVPGTTVTNSANPFGATLRQYGGDLKAKIGGPMESSMGLNELMGPTHEEGGMMISPQVEVEGGETILEPESYVYSDSIKVPGKNKTFAQESKSIKNKYKMRENDKLSQEAMTAELEALMNQQEEVREAMMIKDQERFENRMVAKYGGLMPSMDYSINRNMQPVKMEKGGGIYIKPSKRGTFTAAAENRGMGVQEFASKVMANKEDYSSAMVKKANFAKNAAKWKKENGGKLPEGVLKSRLESHMSPKEVDAYLSEYAMGGFMGGMGMMNKFQDGGELPDTIDIMDNLDNNPNPLNLPIDTYQGLPFDIAYKNKFNRIPALPEMPTEIDMETFQNQRQDLFRNRKTDPTAYYEAYDDEYSRPSKSTNKKDKKKFDPNMLNIPTTAIAGVAAGLKGLGKQKPLLTPQAKVNYINTRPAEVLAERQAELAMAAGLAGLRDNATTQGNYLANVSNMAAQSGIGTGANIANIRFQGDTQNVGLANQGALQRQATIAANNRLLTQAKTAEMLRRDKMLEDANKIAQTGLLDRQKQQQQEFILTELMRQGVVKRDANGKLLMKSDDGKGNVTWIPYYTT
jgi:hypothetical protein